MPALPLFVFQSSDTLPTTCSNAHIPGHGVARHSTCQTFSPQLSVSLSVCFSHGRLNRTAKLKRLPALCETSNSPPPADGTTNRWQEEGEGRRRGRRRGHPRVNDRAESHEWRITQWGPSQRRYWSAALFAGKQPGRSRFPLETDFSKNAFEVLGTWH